MKLKMMFGPTFSKIQVKGRTGLNFFLTTQADNIFNLAFEKNVCEGLRALTNSPPLSQPEPLG